MLHGFIFSKLVFCKHYVFFKCLHFSHSWICRGEGIQPNSFPGHHQTSACPWVSARVICMFKSWSLLQKSWQLFLFFDKKNTESALLAANNNFYLTTCSSTTSKWTATSILIFSQKFHNYSYKKLLIKMALTKWKSLELKRHASSIVTGEKQFILKVKKLFPIYN